MTVLDVIQFVQSDAFPEAAKNRAAKLTHQLVDRLEKGDYAIVVKELNRLVERIDEHDPDAVEIEAKMRESIAFLQTQCARTRDQRILQAVRDRWEASREALHVGPALALIDRLLLDDQLTVVNYCPWFQALSDVAQQMRDQVVAEDARTPKTE